MFRKREQLFLKKMFSLAIDWPLVISRVPNASREIPARLGATARAVDHWLQGRSKPSADHVVGLMAEFDEVADAILEASRRNGGLTQVQKRKLLEAIGEK